MDAPIDVALGLLLPDDTVFTSGYSDRGFKDVRPGMTPSEVQSLLGPPLGSLRLRDGGEVWRFTESPGDTHCYFRTVRFGAEGKVVSKSAGFYVD